MQHYFGEVYERQMQLNELGKLAHDLWQEITNQFPYVELGNFVIMPNHMHGILIINKSVMTRLNDNKPVETRFIASPPENANANPPLNNNNDMDPQLKDNATVETRLIASVLRNGGIAADKNPMLNENISRIIRWYKGRCSFEMRKIHADFKWHSRFHDHIIYPLLNQIQSSDFKIDLKISNDIGSFVQFKKIGVPIPVIKRN